MGIDMHASVEVRRDGKWQYVEIDDLFEYDDSRIYQWLGRVDGRHKVEPTYEPKGLPDDMSDEVYGFAFGSLKRMPFDKASGEAIWLGHEHFGYTWLSLEELLAVDYNQTVCDRHPQTTWENGVPTTIEEESLSLGEFLGEMLAVIEKLKALGDPKDVRLVVWFT